MRSHGPHFRADGRADSLHQVRIPGARQAYGLGEGRGPLRLKAAQALFVKNCRHAQPRVVPEIVLYRIGDGGRLANRQSADSGHARNLSDAFGKVLAGFFFRKPTVLKKVRYPNRAQLGDLLRKGHACQQFGTPSRFGCRRWCSVPAAHGRRPPATPNR